MINVSMKCKERMKTAIFALLLFVCCTGQSAYAACVCRCMNGTNQPICERAIDLRPICPLTVCPLQPPSVTPITPLSVPPIGTSSCREVQVLNPDTQQYQWQKICQ